MFRRVLIANRGEIAARIARSCDALGIETVMVYSEADGGAPWLDAATATLCVGGPKAVASYLDAGAILQAAEQTECQAVHPGYGFLAENARFAARCAQMGLTFIGPSAQQLRRMGDKAEAKRTMAAAGVGTIPGSDGVVGDPDVASRVAEALGYPVLLKAVAGGGGKGMRRCDDGKQLRAAFGPAAQESAKAFGDPSLYVEKLISSGRHVELQILFDAEGNGVHLGERECSIQRKHQKLVEESPSPVVDRTTRERLGREVVAALARCGYRNAGTVEFLRDADGRYFFMEMNTRLQVEHPVTEMVTGIDLVEQQLRIAANERLAFEQADVAVEGHALEFRINAEDPDNDFRPDPGTISAFTAAQASRGTRLRWDSAIVEGYTIPPHYDSLIGKLIVHAPDREAALAGAQSALRSLQVGGVKTTIPFHLRLLGDPGFRKGDYDIEHLTTSGLVDRDGGRRG